jgi:hypothetical protein
VKYRQQAMTSSSCDQGTLAVGGLTRALQMKSVPPLTAWLHKPSKLVLGPRRGNSWVSRIRVVMESIRVLDDVAQFLNGMCMKNLLRRADSLGAQAAEPAK